MISFVVPAHNEEAALPATLRAIHNTARQLNLDYEIVVADDASTDATAAIAREAGARVIHVNHRQIAATRNSGARTARGDRIFFIDADTTVNTRAVAGAMRCMDNGAVGGGAPIWLSLDEVVPLYIRIVAVLQVIFAKPLGFTGGAFMFCTRAAFEATGGLDEQLYWGEESVFQLALKREGKFVALWTPVLTSGRRFRATSGLQVLATLFRTALSPRKMFTQRTSVENIWYDSNRAHDNRRPNSLALRLSNGIALAMLLLLLSGPLWRFIPLSWTPLSSPFGKFKFIAVVFNCHAGLLFWPLALILSLNLLRQKRFAGALQTFAIIAFSAWKGWGSILGVIWIWSQFYQWLA